MLLISVISLVTLAGIIWAFGGTGSYLIAFLVWMFGFQAYIAIESIRLARQISRIRQTAGPDTKPNTTALRTKMEGLSRRYRGRVFRNQTTFLGLPLIDINVSDPGVPIAAQPPDGNAHRRKVARGWIAIGDDARGIFLAIGGTSRGAIAMGGRALGLVSIGGIAVGVVSIGGLAIGLLSLGGMGLGIYAFGGMAIGWQAAGGGAFAWDTACGGLAVARHAAIGGGAFARDLALGGGGSAAHFNDDAAKAVLLAHPLKLGMDWCVANMRWVEAVIVVVALAPTLVMLPLFYRRERQGDLHTSDLE